MYLRFNDNTQRYGILQGDLWLDTGLFCGQQIQALINDEWVETSIEHSDKDGWYLSGLDLPLNYVTVRYGDERDSRIIS